MNNIYGYRAYVFCSVLLILAMSVFCTFNVFALAADAEQADAALDAAASTGTAPADNPPPAITKQPEAENELGEQATYPGVINKRIYIPGQDSPSVSLYYPEFGKHIVDEAMHTFAEAQAANYEADVKDAIGPDDETPASYGMWEMTGFYALERPNPDVASVIFNIYSYSGGAHGGLAIRCLNYNLQSGKQLELDDLFDKPEIAITLFSDFSSKKLHAELGEDADDDMIQAGTAPEADNFANLTLVPDGLIIEFQPYQVGPWSIGPQRVKMTLEDLVRAAPKASIWPKAADLAIPEEDKNSDNPTENPANQPSEQQI